MELFCYNAKAVLRRATCEHLFSVILGNVSATTSAESCDRVVLEGKDAFRGERINTETRLDDHVVYFRRCIRFAVLMVSAEWECLSP